MTRQLPERPDLGQLKKQAKELLDGVRTGHPDSLARIAAHAVEADRFALHDAQRVLAREFGFPGWSQLKLHLETASAAAAEAKLILAALAGDEAEVRTLTAERPGLATGSAYAACALGDPRRIRQKLERDPAFARRPGGPRGWEPLLYLCFGRVGAGDAERAAAAQALLAHGANPNASWIHEDWPESPLPALYGATGVNDYPRLARVLLESRANPNDGESRYHAAEHGHEASLAVLAEFGADFSGADQSWGNTPLFFLLGHEHPSPATRLGLRWLLAHRADPNVVSYAGRSAETALHAAVRHHWDAETVELLLAHGANPSARRADGRTPYALAVAGGREELVRFFQQRGLATEVGATDEFLGACLRADADAARAMVRASPSLPKQLSGEERRLPLVAAREGRARALTLLREVGFDLDVVGGDGERPLHWAAWHGWADAVRALIAAGVNLDACDRRFHAPPSGWCAHGSANCPNPAGDHAAVLELLIAAGAAVAPHTSGSAEVMAVLKRHSLGPERQAATVQSPPISGD